MGTILKLEDLCYGYIDGGYKREILKKLSYSFEEGTFYTILGPSGSGKTTLLSIMAGLDKQESGHVYYQDEDIDQMGLYKYRRNKIGVVFQSYNLITYLTGLENILVAMTETDNDIPGNHKDMAYALLNMVGIANTKADRLVTHLSGGEQQRIAIARAIAANVDLIFADEPTGNLDTETEQEIIKLFQMLSEKYGKTIIAVTHSNEVSKLSDHRVLLKNGVLQDL
ncbi:ATP-binding cassette domain-containing protein [Erysipelotrichaceae bacterium Oil+RF-744-GAM-WT-6]|jgi:putative ABC transport system ATP-binding protein|uniref:ATP-binding cassette domain-containing protein n=1 Tax=Stecheria intestinalis TaxID=2606630 RepID=A0A7X2TH03_9FIRM|nr:ATP-binding cassette domain-containing protein [Stecheria intestinalis]MSS59031.1 ATP-binding cassette domain-containing protein [Stecheria intestinalis]